MKVAVQFSVQLQFLAAILLLWPVDSSAQGSLSSRIVFSKQCISEGWDEGLDTLRWNVWGQPEPLIRHDLGWSGTAGLDPNGDGWCESGVWLKQTVSWGPGSRLSARFITNTHGSGCNISTYYFPSPRHEIWTGVAAIQGNTNVGSIETSFPAEVIAVDANRSINMVAAFDDAVGRIVWDDTWYRFTDASADPELSILQANNVQYAKNVALWLARGSAQNGSRILLYTTRRYGDEAGSRSWHYDEDLPDTLATEGFVVTVYDRETIPGISADILAAFDQLWLISTENCGILDQAEIDAIHAFHASGKGLLIVGGSTAYYGPANQVSAVWGVRYQDGEYNNCGRGDYWQEIQIGLAPGELTTGVCAAENEIEPELYALIHASRADYGERIGVFKKWPPWAELMTFPYEAAQDNRWHEISFIADQNNRISLLLDGTPLDTTDGPVPLGDSLHIYVSGRSYGAINVVDDIYHERAILSLSDTMLNLGSVTSGRTSSRDIVIENLGSPDLTLTRADVSFGSDAFSLSSDDWSRLDAGIHVPLGSAETLAVCFAPLETHAQNELRDTMTLRIDEYGSPIRVSLQAKHMNITFDWLNDFLYKQRHEIGEAKDISFWIRTGDSVQIDGVNILCAAGGSRAYRTMPCFPCDSMKHFFAYNLPAAIGGARGLDFYIEVRNGLEFATSGPPRHLRVWCNDVPSPHEQSAMSYGMISVPIEVHGDTIATENPTATVMRMLEDDLGKQSIDTWRVFTYDRSAPNHYKEITHGAADNFEQGRAYWLITRHGATIDTAPLKALSTPVDSPFVLRLQEGWNQVGNPFDFPISCDSILVGRFPQPISMRMAWMIGLIERPLRWDAARKQYADSVKVLEPFEGYWIRNTSGVALELRMLPREATAIEARCAASPGASRGNLDSIHGETDWHICISASCGANSDTYNVLGTSRAANNMHDQYDQCDPPPYPGEYVSLYFPHTDWKRFSGPYSVDLRGSSDIAETRELANGLLKHELWGQVWRFDISKNFAERSSGDEITLDFTGIESASQDMEILLIDRDLARLIDLRKTSRYQFYLGEKGFVSNDAEARFMIIAGTGESVKEHESELLQLPEVTRLCQNYPNPFNPTTLIRFDISSAADVELKIYDAPGAFVRELFTGRCAPGRYEVEWDGVSSNGQPVASGIYFCRLRTEQLMQTRKLILLR